ncbi:hypothetical protein BD310DRAFT_826463 [Dichomitus squalens]|uniref:Uncharacterized protein n=1 Tax=Dichomitus squalens TaxID=114155 RepID=A0A4Q9PM01_9APHY|nr:hypothetical protein BD310DRAFT_826463 [Dichomitus squalens]
MNDALQAVRTAIGYKSLLYRTKVRAAPSYKSRLRSYDDIHVVDDGVRKYVKIYSNARRAIQHLYDINDTNDCRALEDILQKYCAIKPEDLRANTAVLEVFTPGLCGQHASWLWHIKDNLAGRDDSWMTNFRRVMWLRAHARKCRWDKERILVSFEMECVVRSFKKKETEWRDLARSADLSGHRAYAHRQAAMWRGLKEYAEDIFRCVQMEVQPESYTVRLCRRL